MADQVPYLAAPGSIKTALEKIRQAATPARVTGDFISTVVGIKGGTGRALIPFFKKIGLVNSDGTPSELYKRFRNPSVGGSAIAEAIKMGYKPLAKVNEYFYRLNDTDLKSLMIQVTGGTADTSAVKLGLLTLKALKAYADFEADFSSNIENSANAPAERQAIMHIPDAPFVPNRGGAVGLNLSYTINLNLPPTPDQAVFNAIFRSLREHLLSNAD